MTLAMEPSLMVDTNVVSYVMRGDTLAKLYLPHLQGKLLSISFSRATDLMSGVFPSPSVIIGVEVVIGRKW